jgi:hypothetical protein
MTLLDRQLDRYLFERLVGAERDGALGRHAGANEDVAALLEPFPNEVLGRLRRCGVDDVDVGGRRSDSEAAGVVGVREDASP